MKNETDVFCIYINTFFQGRAPSNGVNMKSPWCMRPAGAEREIVEYCIERLRQYLAGERDFDDAITVEEYVVPVTAFPDGSISDERGHVFPNENW